SQSILYEELQATHEEVLASNEELQTKNEELETTQEELRAANEELRTVNDEVLDRNEQLDLANARLEKLTVRLTEEEAYASAIVETVREPLLVLDRNLRVVSANHAFYEKFRVKKESTEGETIFRLGNGQWDIPALKELLENVLPGRDVVSDFEVSHEFPRIGLRTMLLNAREVARESGAEAYILLAIEDISDRVRQRTALIASKDRVESERDVSRTDAAELRLERSLREKFVLALSHDLRNPLTGAKLSAQLLIRRAGGDPHVDEGTLRTLRRIVENMDRADRMITDLLDANRIKAGQGVSLKREAMDLGEYLRAQSTELGSRYGDRLVWQQEDGALPGEWDPDAITRILENLIGNAFKYGLDPEPVTVK
ncbi:MAG: PAS domain-containing sensor histidine kinase, partial [Proteobacteria bacterium]